MVSGGSADLRSSACNSNRFRKVRGPLKRNTRVPDLLPSPRSIVKGPSFNIAKSSVRNGKL